MCCNTFCQPFVFRGCFLLAKSSQPAAPKASGREVSNFTNQNKTAPHQGICSRAC